MCVKDKCGLPRRFQLALTKLNNNEDIIISKSDKGGKVGVLNTTDCLDKANDLLSDEARGGSSFPCWGGGAIRLGKNLTDCFKDILLASQDW